MPIDYSSQSYWELRLAKERDVGYEWLVPTSAILPIISTHGIPEHRCTRILHFGCGSSFLGREIQRAFGSRVAVTDADYAAVSLQSSSTQHSASIGGDDREVRLVDLDVLSLSHLVACSPVEGWDLLVDKSTADAISCGPPCGSSNGIQREAIEVLCDNLAQVTRPAGRWVSVSYSSERFDFLSKSNDSQWSVLYKKPIKLLPATAVGSKGIVYQPETGVWVWVLERVHS